MRTASSSLLAEQKKVGNKPIWKTILSRTAQSTRGYDRNRVIKMSLTETPSGDNCEIVLDNHDNALTALDLEHYLAELSWGYDTGISRNPWVAGSAYSMDDIVIPTTANGYQYRCKVAGTSNNAGLDVGSAATDRATRVTTPSTTTLDFSNPVNADGIVTSVQIYANTDMAGVKVGMFYNTSGNVYACRSTTTIGNVTSGSVQTFSVSLTAKVGDVIGILWTSGGIESDSSGGTAISQTIGDYFTVGAEFQTSQQSGKVLSLYAEGGITPTFPTALGVTVADSSVTWEMDGNQGEEYSRCAPLRVRNWELHSGRGLLKAIVRPTGLLNQLGEDAATAAYTTTASDTSTVQDRITTIASTALAPYGAYTAASISYDSVDGMMSTYQPKDYFSVKINETRLAKIQELTGYTKTKMLPKNDGGVHFVTPTISGTAYDYEYKFNVAGDHPFFAKTVRQRFVNPNKEIVQTPTGAGTAYSGNATSATSFALAPKVHTTVTQLPSSAVAASIAAAKIEQYELESDKGIITVPMNVAQELWDYVKVTDSRQGDTRVGNVQYINRVVERFYDNKPLVWRMTIALGKPSQLSLMAAQADMGGQGTAQWSADAITQQFQSIIDILNEMSLGMQWQSQETWTIDNETLDDIPDGSTYTRLLATSITAGQIKITSSAVFNGQWYDNSGVIINATTGIDIYGGSTAFRTYESSTSATIQCQVDSSGRISAGAGNVLLSAGGLRVGAAADTSTTGVIQLAYNDSIRGYVYGAASDLHVQSWPSHDVIIDAASSTGDRVRVLQMDTTLTDVSASRAAATVYQNTTGCPLYVTVVASLGPGDTADLMVGAATTTVTYADRLFNNAGVDGLLAGLHTIVPIGWYYKVTDGGGSIDKWIEVTIGD